MSTTSRQSITLTEPQMAWLASEAKALGVTVSEVVRRVIDQFRAGVVYVPGGVSKSHFAAAGIAEALSRLTPYELSAELLDSIGKDRK